MERKKSSSTSSQVRTHSVPRTPTQVRHPPPHSSLRASKGEHQAGAQPCPKGPEASQTAPPLSWLPSLQQAQVGVRPGWGLCPLGGKKPTNQPSLAPGSSLGVLAFSLHHHHHL